MYRQHTEIEPPSDDKRWRIVNATMRRHGYHPHALIETLHSVQQSFGYLDDDALRYVSASLRVPLSQTYGVATFYHFFQLKPGGRHNCVVCLGTACYIKGSDQVLERVSEAYDIQPGQTTEDGEISLLTARCIGSCGLAPAVVVDGNVVPKMTPDNVIEQIRRITGNGSR